MRLSNYALDTFVAQDMSKLKKLSVDSLVGEFQSADCWLEHFVHHQIFQAHISGDKTALAFVIVRRAHVALQEWELTSTAAQGDPRNIGIYFSVLHHLEACLSAVWQGLEFARKSLAEDLFKRGDGGQYERMNWLYNTSRHFDPMALHAGDLHRVWLSDDSMHTREHALSFDELREAVRMLARVAEKVAGS